MIKRVWHSRFAQNVFVLVSGTAGAQVIAIVATPIVTRLYGPEAYGLLGVFVALLAVLTPISALTYPTGIVLPKEDSEAYALVQVALCSALVICSVVGLAVLGTGDWLIHIIGSESLAPFLILIPIVMFFSAIGQISEQWLIRKRQFSVTARIAVIQALFVNGTKVSMGLFYPLSLVLIWIATVGYIFHSFLLAIFAKNKKAKETTVGLAPECYPLKVIARKYNAFPLYRAPQAFINSISRSLPILLLASFFGPATAGFYALAKMVLGAPLTLIGKAVGDVFYPHIVEASHNKKNLAHYIIKATLILALLGAFPYALIAIFGPFMFDFVFGEQWRVSGNYAQWLALWFYVGFINRPAMAALPVLNLQGYFLLYEILSLSLRVLSLFIGFAWFQSDITAIALFSLTGVLLNTALITFTIIAAKNRTCLPHV